MFTFKEYLKEAAEQEDKPVSKIAESVTYAQVTFSADGKTQKTYLRVTKDSDKFLSGYEVNKDGDEIASKGHDRRLRVIDKHAVTKVVPMRMDRTYATLVKEDKPVSKIAEESTPTIERKGTTTGRWINYQLFVNGQPLGRIKSATDVSGGIGIRTRTGTFKAYKGYWVSPERYTTTADAEQALFVHSHVKEELSAQRR